MRDLEESSKSLTCKARKGQEGSAYSYYIYSSRGIKGPGKQINESLVIMLLRPYITRDLAYYE
jgi:hypothetical protein